VFEEWYLTELISPVIKDVWKLTDYYLMKLINDIFEKNGINDILKFPVTVNDIIKKNNYSESSYSSIKWMLDRLSLDGYIKNENANYSLSGKTMDYNLANIREEAEKKAPDSIAAFNMLKLMADNYPDYFSGKKTGVDIIFSPENIDTTNSYYSNNLFYNVHNIAGARILNWDIESRKNPVIIEIGGGLGGGTKQFLSQRVNDKKDINNFKYIFTDVANKMLRSTRRDLSLITDNLGAFYFQKLDFNKKLVESGYEENSTDVVWGVNAVHVASDLRFSLEEFYKTLKPGGSIIIAETVRPAGNRMIQQEFLLNTLPDYWNTKLDSDIRPRSGFMDWSLWVNALVKIGFTDVKTIPDMRVLENQYDNCYVAVIRGVKPQ
jgi:SAM-dependent methyltransferase